MSFWHPVEGIEAIMLIWIRVNRCAVLPQCSTWWNQKGLQERSFVSGCKAGIRCCRRRLPMSKKESDQKTVKGSHQHSSSTIF